MFQLGQLAPLHGNVTTLDAVAGRSPPDLERSVGFGSGRLSAGYQVAVLRQPLTEADFEFDGTTRNSGGRWGLPRADAAADALRPGVQAGMVRDYGQAGYDGMKRAHLPNATLIGERRIVKLLPVTLHDPRIGPDVQYPPGQWRLQWRLVRDCTFLIALQVDAAGRASTAADPAFATLAPGAPYEDRQRVARFLATA